MDDDKVETTHQETTPPEHETHEVTPPPPQHPDHTETLNDLSARIGALESVVQGLLPANRDETPVKTPWTHKRF